MTKKNLVGEMLGMEVAREYKADFIDGPLSYDTLVGVEIEYEHSGLAQFPESAAANLWRRHEDGSLRDGGAELVFRAPLSGGRVVDAISYAELALKRCRFSTRTS